MSRLVLFLFVITMPMSSAACAFGCNDDRNPSRILIELAEPLPEDSYDVLVCVDDDCDQFIGIGAPGTGATPGASIEIRSNLIIVTPWSRQIESGEHRVAASVSIGDRVLLHSDGPAEFESNGRCYEEDSTATIRMETLQGPLTWKDMSGRSGSPNRSPGSSHTRRWIQPRCAAEDSSSPLVDRFIARCSSRMVS